MSKKEYYANYLEEAIKDSLKLVRDVSGLK
jgi:hypothetical protein